MENKQKPAGIFTTNKLGPKILFDEKGEICKFQDTKSDVMETQQGFVRNDKAQSIWVAVVFDQEKAERVRKLPGFNKTIIEVESMPAMNAFANLAMTGMPNQVNAEAIREQAKQDARLEIEKALAEAKVSQEAERNQMIADTKRYGELYAKLITKNGKFAVGVAKELKEEFESLETKLGIPRNIPEGEE